MRKANSVGTSLELEILRKMEAARGERREEAERAKREAEETARREAEGGRVVGLPGQWRGGWKVMPVSEQERAETGWFARSLMGLGDRPNNEEGR